MTSAELDQARQASRQHFFDAWQKHLENKPLEPLEQQLVDLIIMHPEYQSLFTNTDDNLDRDFNPELNQTNPFLHLSLHLSILEQVSTNHPKGIRKQYQLLVKKYGVHDTEHKIMDILAEAMWQMQRNNSEFDEHRYLKQIKRLG